MPEIIVAGSTLSSEVEIPTGALLTYPCYDKSIEEFLIEEIHRNFYTSQEQELDEDAEFYLFLIEKKITELDKFPDSYNQALLKGILRYCSRIAEIVKKRSLDQHDIFVRVKNLVDEIEDLIKQLENEKEALINLNLQLYEDRFDLLQYRSDMSNVLPTLDKLAFPVSEE